MTYQQNIAELQARVEALSRENRELTANLADRVAALNEAEARAVEAENSLAEAVAENRKLTERLAEATAQAEQSAAALATLERANGLAVLAPADVPAPIADAPAVVERTDAELLAEFEGLRGAEATNFFKTYERELKRAMAQNKERK